MQKVDLLHCFVNCSLGDLMETFGRVARKVSTPLPSPCHPPGFGEAKPVLYLFNAATRSFYSPRNPRASSSPYWHVCMRLGMTDFILRHRQTLHSVKFFKILFPGLREEEYFKISVDRTRAMLQALRHRYVHDPRYRPLITSR